MSAQRQPRHLDDYVKVHSRVEEFRQAHPTARLITNIIKDEPLTVRCEIYLDGNDSGIPNSSGMADEHGGMGNRGKMLEKIETAAAGRALAFLGYGIREGLASQEDVDARPRPVAPPTATPTDKATTLRDRRAEGIASMGLVTKGAAGYNVQTPSLKGKVITYLVTKEKAGPVCDCQEFQDSTDPTFQCEHILAVKHAVKSGNVKDTSEESRLRSAIFKELNRLYQSEEDINAYLQQNYKLDIDGVQSADIKMLKGMAGDLEIS